MFEYERPRRGGLYKNLGGKVSKNFGVNSLRWQVAYSYYRVVLSSVEPSKIERFSRKNRNSKEEELHLMH